MALTLTYYEASLCPDCGVPTWVGYGPENIERAEFTTDICHWCESAATARRDLEKQHTEGIPAGWKLMATDTFDQPGTPTT